MERLVSQHWPAALESPHGVTEPAIPRWRSHPLPWRSCRILIRHEQADDAVMPCVAPAR